MDIIDKKVCFLNFAVTQCRNSLFRVPFFQYKANLLCATADDLAQDAVKALIMERFDHASAGGSATTPLSPPGGPSKAHTNGVAKKIKTETKVKKERPTSDGTPDDDDDDGAPPKKKRKQNKGVKDEGEPDADAKLAAKLQAEENSRSRATRGGGAKKKAPTKKRAPKKKSSDKVKAEDDSDIEVGSDGEIKEKVKKGGFHKLYNLSAPLADLVGEVSVSISSSSC